MEYKIGDRVVAYFVDKYGDEVVVIGELSEVRLYNEESEMYDFGINIESILQPTPDYADQVNIFKHNILCLADKKMWRKKDEDRENITSENGE